MYHQRTSYSGGCPAPLWDEFKEVSPAQCSLGETINYAVALTVATYRYDQLEGDAQAVVDDILATDMPVPVATTGGCDVQTLLDDLQSEGDR